KAKKLWIAARRQLRVPTDTLRSSSRCCKNASTSRASRSPNESASTVRFRRPLDSPLYDPSHVQFACNFWKRFVGLFVTHDGGARNHLHGPHLRKVGNQRVGHAV